MDLKILKGTYELMVDSWRTLSSINQQLIRMSNKLAETIRLNDLSDMLNLNDLRTTKKWLNTKGIPFHKLGKELVVHRFAVELILQLELVETLMVKFPKKWAEMYMTQMEDEKMLKAVFLVHAPKSYETKLKRTTNTKFLK